MLDDVDIVHIVRDTSKFLTSTSMVDYVSK